MKNIAILVSGSGTNMENISRYFEGSTLARIALVISDNPAAYALTRAQAEGIETLVMTRPETRRMGALNSALQEHGIDFLALAGYLSLIPADVTWVFDHRIVNIHPALLPAYGGKGMYGMRVHEAVIAAGEKESGITIHYVNERYDEGNVIAQFRISVSEGETPESLAEKIHALEYEHYPKVIERLLLELPEKA